MANKALVGFLNLKVGGGKEGGLHHILSIKGFKVNLSRRGRVNESFRVKGRRRWAESSH